MKRLGLKAMRVLLDTRDLINLLEKGDPCHPDTLRELLERGQHHLCLNVGIVRELSAPLIQLGRKTAVMPLLLELEKFPIAYLAEGRIPKLELEEAVQAFGDRREYTPLDPYVSRFDHAATIDKPPLTRLYLRYSLAEIVYDLWQNAPDFFKGPPYFEQRLRQVLESERSLGPPPGASRTFRLTLHKDLQLFQVAANGIDLDRLADWIIADPRRCPGLRLQHEVFQYLRRNLGDKAKASDFGDLVNVSCLPLCRSNNSRQQDEALYTAGYANLVFTSLQ